MKKGNKKIQELFDEGRLSKRFHIYQRDSSPRGRALYLNQILMHLKHEFAEFAPALDQAMTTIKIKGVADDKTQQAWIIQSLRRYASTVTEISEETNLTKDDVRNHLKTLLLEKKVIFIESPVSNDWRDRMWFLA